MDPDIETPHRSQAALEQEIQRLQQEGSAGDAALREAQGLNTLILESTTDCIVLLDLEGNTLFVSPGGIAAMEVVDVPAIIGLSWLRVWKDADNVAARAAVEVARNGGVGRFQGFCATHAGRPKWWDVMVSPLPGLDGRPERLVSVGRDITDGVQARTRLRFSEETLRLAIEAADIGTWDLDLETDVLTWSDRTRAMFGISPGADCSMQDFYRGLHPDDVEATSKAFASSLDPELRATYDVEYRTIGRDDGVVRWVAAVGRGIFAADGRCIRAIGTAIDVTRRRSIEDRLRQSEAALLAMNTTLANQVEERTRERDRIWDVSQDMLLVIDLGGIIRAVNPAWTQTLGWSSDALTGQSFEGFVHPDDLAASRAAVVHALGEALPAFENRYRHRDGSWRNIAWTAAPSGDLIYCVARDVTVERRREAELAEAQEQLRQSQKMEAVGQLTGGLAHDFNNLLAGIKGSLELLRRRLEQGRLQDLERYIGVGLDATNRAAALTHRLLAFSRRQTLAPVPTDANRLVRDMEDLIRRTVGPGVIVETVFSAGLWPTLCDPNQLENALLNLCINARDAMPEGGRLVIETGNRWMDDRTARLRDLQPGQYISLCVSDNGTGMSPEVITRAFDPFFTTKPIGMGTGLGLSMIYGFARQSSGQARIYSEEGQGSMVCLYLPRHLGDLVEEARHEAEMRLPRVEQGETVLVVDDEPSVRMTVVEVLEELGYTALEASDGASGLAILQSDTRIDLLVTDVGLPGGMNGRQMADAGRSLRAGLKVLFITGYAENAVLSHGHLAPGMHVLTKPFGMDMLADRLKTLVSGG